MIDRPDAFKPRTIAAQALGAIEPETKGVALPIHVSTTFIRDPDNQYRTGYIYGRPAGARESSIAVVSASSPLLGERAPARVPGHAAAPAGVPLR